VEETGQTALIVDDFEVKSAAGFSPVASMKLMSRFQQTHFNQAHPNRRAYFFGPFPIFLGRFQPYRFEVLLTIQVTSRLASSVKRGRA
jgi:hypothetical protein